MGSVEYKLIEAVVRRTLGDIRDCPERTLRNLLDMALQFTEKKFETEFFGDIRHMLENDDSAYYALARDVAMHVDNERLLRFGMNIGFNGCLEGSKVIRSIEDEQHFNIPWSLTLIIDANRIQKLQRHYHDLIQQANELGIYTFLIRPKGSAKAMLPLIEAHANCAFVLFCNPEDITPAFIDACDALHHLMLAVRFCPQADEACAMLRERKFLYALDVSYGEKEAAGILSGDTLDAAQQLHPLFTLFTPEASCPESVCQRVYEGICQLRNMQRHATIPLDVTFDFKLIHSIISNESCSACFDESGTLWTEPDCPQRCGHVFETPLASVLRQAFPKQ